jgi:hypothetical protein
MRMINNKVTYATFLLVLTCALTLGYCGSHVSAMVSGDSIQATDLTVNNIHGSTGHYTFLKAYLSDEHGKAVPNKCITFKVDGDPHDYIAVTSPNGHALLYYYIPQNPGTYSIKTEFKGDENFASCVSTGVLTVV